MRAVEGIDGQSVPEERRAATAGMKSVLGLWISESRKRAVGDVERGESPVGVLV